MSYGLTCRIDGKPAQLISLAGSGRVQLAGPGRNAFWCDPKRCSEWTVVEAETGETRKDRAVAEALVKNLMRLA